MASPPKIQKLEEAVINRIAAGEVIQRPASAVKEMLENSLDAGATTITVTAKSGGVASLQITDNGHGIEKTDFAIVCQRFTTSKLREYEDLQSISTFGFRGEALASISHVAKLTITSATASSPCAYRASYADGNLVSSEPGMNEPVPCAGVKGTSIQVEDLFFNVSTRKKAIRNLSDEYNRILEVVTRYAIHNAGVGFTCKKAGCASAELHTLPSATVRDNIANVWGQTLTQELLEVRSENVKLQFKMHGHISNANYSTKREISILFINNRLVECSSIRKAIAAVYMKFLPKGAHPFVYLGLEMEPSNLDVNVHPTKREVHFLHEEAILAEIVAEIETMLESVNESRTFMTQTILPGAQQFIQEANALQPPASGAKLVPANSIVRTSDPNPVGQLDTYFLPTSKRRREDNDTSDVCVSQPAMKRKVTVESTPQVELTSVNNLWSNIIKQCHPGLQQVFNTSVFVGCADEKFFFMQSGTKLYLTSCAKVSKHLFYQQALLNFAHFERIVLSTPTPINDIVLVALDFPSSGWSPSAGSKEQIAGDVSKLLTARREMLDEYFSITIDPEGRLSTLPCLLPNHIPDLDGLPSLILRLGTEVNWLEEEPCFHDVASELSRFYSSCLSVETGEHGTVSGGYARLMQHVIYPCVKQMLIPSSTLGSDGSLIEVACLQKLFKIFERC